MYRILLQVLPLVACLSGGTVLEAAEDEGKQVTEGVVEAPVGVVWAALATKEGLESWNVAHAEVDLKLGGKMRTRYDPKGKLGDQRTIVNTILSFEPRRMLSIKATGLPEGFPYPRAIQSVWTTIYFEEAGAGRTRIRLVGQGYGSDEESKKLRAFFARGNAYTLQKLQKHFASRKGNQIEGN
jgi:uncharacterized protein YndB with AHSA1/START domain